MKKQTYSCYDDLKLEAIPMHIVVTKLHSFSTNSAQQQTNQKSRQQSSCLNASCDRFTCNCGMNTYQSTSNRRRLRYRGKLNKFNDHTRLPKKKVAFTNKLSSSSPSSPSSSVSLPASSRIQQHRFKRSINTNSALYSAILIFISIQVLSSVCEFGLLSANKIFVFGYQESEFSHSSPSPLSYLPQESTSSLLPGIDTTINTTSTATAVHARHKHSSHKPSAFEEHKNTHEKYHQNKNHHNHNHHHHNQQHHSQDSSQQNYKQRSNHYHKHHHSKVKLKSSKDTDHQPLHDVLTSKYPDDILAATNTTLQSYSIQPQTSSINTLIEQEDQNSRGKLSSDLLSNNKQHSHHTIHSYNNKNHPKHKPQQHHKQVPGLLPTIISLRDNSYVSASPIDETIDENIEDNVENNTDRNQNTNTNNNSNNNNNNFVSYRVEEYDGVEKKEKLDNDGDDVDDGDNDDGIETGNSKLASSPTKVTSLSQSSHSQISDKLSLNSVDNNKKQKQSATTAVETLGILNLRTGNEDKNPGVTSTNSLDILKSRSYSSEPNFITHGHHIINIDNNRQHSKSNLIEGRLHHRFSWEDNLSGITISGREVSLNASF